MTDQTALETLAELGSSNKLTHELENKLSDIVCKFYGQNKIRDVNEARYQIFWSNYKRRKIIDLCLLPPCSSSLKLHCKRANYIAQMWRTSDQPIQSLPPVTECGWKENFQIHWSDQSYPDDIAEILVNDEESELVTDAEDMYIDENDNDDESVMESIENYASQFEMS